MKLLASGQNSLDILARPIPPDFFRESTTFVSGMKFNSGGDAFNVSVVSSRLGNEVTYIGALGDDLGAKYLREVGAREGVDMRYCAVKPVSTCMTMVLIPPDGQQRFVHDKGANALLRFEDFPSEAIDPCDFVYFGGALSMPGMDGEGLKRLFAAARERGKTTFLDITPDSTGRWMRSLEACLPYVDYFIPSMGEAEHLVNGSAPEEIALGLKEYGCKNVVLKLGGEGCLVLTDAEMRRVAPFRVEIVDTTGAGDNFVSGFMTALGMGRDPFESARFASAVSALCIQKVGTTDAVQSREQVEAFLSAHS